MQERKFWNEKIECMPMEEMEKLRFRRLEKQIKYCYNSSSFFKKKFDEVGVKPEDIKCWEDFRKLPILVTKEDHIKCQEESTKQFGHPFGTFLCAPLEKVVGVGSTGGTTGFPTFYAYTQHDIEVTHETLSRLFWRAGIRPGDTVLHANGLSMWVGGIPWVVALQRFGARGIPVGAEAGSIRILQYADICKPKAIIGTPSLFEHLIERAPEIIGKEVDKLGIKKLICMGGPGAGISQVRKRLIDAYNVREVYDTTGGGWGCASISCEGPEYRGMHVLTDDYFIWYDIIDPDTKKPLPIEDGTIGEGLLTSFEFEALPALKYKMGDLIQVFTKPCECGWPGYRFRILERVDDMLIVKGAKVYPIAVKNIVNSFIPRTTGEMRIVLTTPPPKIEPPVIVKVEYGKGLDSREISTLKEELEERIKGILRVRASIEPVPPGSLERVSFKGSLIERRYQKK